MTALVALSLLAAQRILFVGNRHTSNGGEPELVRSLLANAVPAVQVTVRVAGVSLLNDVTGSSSIQRDISSGKWDVVVLQGAKISSSHKYTYTQEGAINAGKWAREAGSRVLFFAEWPRKGWDETDYILGVYKGIAAKVPGSEIIEIGRTWDALLKDFPKLDLWSGDGNHSSALGAYVASCCIARAVAPKSVLSWHPVQIDPQTAQHVLARVK